MNRLADETSPYLLQHAGNPVHWHAWNEEALERARREQMPVLLSVGYAACHWCHVMEHESFEDQATAELMNAGFVCIKVDREERPDVDDVYMQAVQMMTGRGGWPLTVFLTPDLEPFYGGTYFPPDDRHGMPSFRRVLAGVLDAWNARRAEVEESAAHLRERLQARVVAPAAEIPETDLLRQAALALHDRFDPNYGGYGPAPKFPSTGSIAVQLRYGHDHGDSGIVDQALFTLRQMIAGGIHDHLAGGFHRYSTDARWLVPHFEKMLYDNALLAFNLLDAHVQTGHEDLAVAARATLDWAIADMQTAEGGFASTIDADSEGVEGKFYVWSRAEIVDVLGDEAELFCAAYDVSEGGNWEGVNVLNVPRPLDRVADDHGMTASALHDLLAESRRKLRARRAERTPPALDDKVLTDWNGLMIAALARGHRTLAEPRYLDAARRAADFVFATMESDGRLLHSYRAGQARVVGYLDDHAAMALASIELFESTSELVWLERARALVATLREHFWDAPSGGFFFTAGDGEALIARPRSGHDGATPSGNALAVSAISRLARWTDDAEMLALAEGCLRAFAPVMERAPAGFGWMLGALCDHTASPRELVVVGSADDRRVGEALARAWRRYAPAERVLHLDPQRSDLDELERRVPLAQGKATAVAPGEVGLFACSNGTCAAPTSDIAAALEQLQAEVS